MAYSADELKVANMALGRIGGKQIALTTDLDTPVLPTAVQVALHYAQTRDALLRSYDWNFAVKRLALVGTWVTGAAYIVGQYVWQNSLLYRCPTGKAHTSNDFATDLGTANWVLDSTRPSFGYDYQYVLPTDCLRFRKTDIDDYSIEGKLILADEQTINIEYINQEDDPTIWDTMFYDCMVLKLALNLLHPLAGTSVVPMRQMLEQELYQTMARARTITAQETNSSGASDWNDARYNSTW